MAYDELTIPTAAVEVPCSMCDSVAAGALAKHPQLIAVLEHGQLVLHSQQGQRGWCVLELRKHAEHLSDLPATEQAAIFAEVARAAVAVRRVTGCGRINYECLGNVTAHVHWHIIPRYPSDPDTKAPVWGFAGSHLSHQLAEEDRRTLIAAIAAELGAEFGATA